MSTPSIDPVDEQDEMIQILDACMTAKKNLIKDFKERTDICWDEMID